QAAEQARYRSVEPRLTSERIVELLRARDQVGQLVVELVGRERGVGAVIADRPLDPGATAGPGLLGGVAWAHEQQERRRVAGAQEHDDARLLEPGQVQDVAVLPELVLHVAVTEPFRRRREQQRARRTDALEDAGAAFRVR